MRRLGTAAIGALLTLSSWAQINSMIKYQLNNTDAFADVAYYGFVFNQGMMKSQLPQMSLSLINRQVVDGQDAMYILNNKSIPLSTAQRIALRYNPIQGLRAESANRLFERKPWHHQVTAAWNDNYLSSAGTDFETKNQMISWNSQIYRTDGSRTTEFRSLLNYNDKSTSFARPGGQSLEDNLLHAALHFNKGYRITLNQEALLGITTRAYTGSLRFRSDTASEQFTSFDGNQLDLSMFTRYTRQWEKWRLKLGMFFEQVYQSFPQEAWESRVTLNTGLAFKHGMLSLEADHELKFFQFSGLKSLPHLSVQFMANQFAVQLAASRRYRSIMQDFHMYSDPVLYADGISLLRMDKANFSVTQRLNKWRLGLNMDLEQITSPFGMLAFDGKMQLEKLRSLFAVTYQFDRGLLVDFNYFHLRGFAAQNAGLPEHNFMFLVSTRYIELDNIRYFGKSRNLSMKINLYQHGSSSQSFAYLGPGGLNLQQLPDMLNTDIEFELKAHNYYSRWNSILGVRLNNILSTQQLRISENYILSPRYQNFLPNAEFFIKLDLGKHPY